MKPLFIPGVVLSSGTTVVYTAGMVLAFVKFINVCVCVCVCVCVKLLQSCLTLCDPMNCSLPGSSVHVILQARILEWVAMPSCRGLPDPGIKPTSLMSPALASEFFTNSTTWETQSL